jgi:hypothetical protein
MIDYLYFCVEKFAVVYYSILYFIITFVLSTVVDKYVIYTKNEKFTNNDEEPNIYLLFLEIIFYFGIIGLVFNLIIFIGKHIPFPFDKIDKFDIHQLKEYQGGIIISTIFFIFQKKLKNKLDYLTKLLNI